MRSRRSRTRRNMRRNRSRANELAFIVSGGITTSISSTGKDAGASIQKAVFEERNCETDEACTMFKKRTEMPKSDTFFMFGGTAMPKPETFMISEATMMP